MLKFQQKIVAFNVTRQQNIIKRSISSLNNLTEEHQILQKTCRTFAEKELAPIASELDRENKFPAEQIKKLGEMGMMSICAETKYGGSGLNTLALSLCVEELSRGCASTGAIVSIHNSLFVNLLQRKGNEKQKEEFLKPMLIGGKIGSFALSESGAGSDVGSISTTAKKDGDHWIINGNKAWVTSAYEAEVGIFFATIDRSLKHKGITGFIIPLNTPGVSLGKKEDKMGIRGSSTCDINLGNVRVHKDNVIGDVGGGFKLAMEQLDQARIGIASQAIGISQASFDIAINYASERIAFDLPILNMQTVQLRLADMALKIETARLITQKAAILYDSKKSTKYCSMAKLAASECANFVTNNSIQILGGMGFVNDLPAERHYRDAKITEIYGGITDVQKLIIAEQLIKEYGLKK